MNWFMLLFPKKEEPACRHDWDMQFPDPNSLGWEFVCKKCGKKRLDMPMPDELI